LKKLWPFLNLVSILYIFLNRYWFHIFIQEPMDEYIIILKYFFDEEIERLYSQLCSKGTFLCTFWFSFELSNTHVFIWKNNIISPWQWSNHTYKLCTQIEFNENIKTCMCSNIALKEIWKMNKTSPTYVLFRT